MEVIKMMQYEIIPDEEIVKRIRSRMYLEVKFNQMNGFVRTTPDMGKRFLTIIDDILRDADREGLINYAD